MKDSIDDIKNIDLVQYAYQNGYNKRLNGRENSIWITLKNESNGDAIRIRQKPLPMVYNNNDLNLEKDRGNIVNFVINRQGGYVSSNNTSPSKEQFKEAFSTLKKFLGEVDLEQAKPAFLDSSNQKKFDPTDVNNLIRNLEEPSSFSYSYLANIRLLNPNTIHHPLFAAKFKESPVMMQNKKMIGNFAIVKTDLNNAVTGFVTHYFSAKESKTLKTVYETKDNIWKSNLFEHSTHLIFGESAVDCLSHFELRNPKNAVYASFEGYASDNKLQALFDLYSKIDTPSKTITSITDNDYAGYNYDLKTAVFFHNQLHPDKPIEVIQEQNFIKYILHSELPNEVNLKELKDTMQQYLRLEAPNHHQLFTPYLNMVELKDKVIFEVPYKKDNVKVCCFLKPLIELFFKQNGIAFHQHKAKVNDWNEQLIQQRKKELSNEQQQIRKAGI